MTAIASQPNLGLWYVPHVSPLTHENERHKDNENRLRVDLPRLTYFRCRPTGYSADDANEEHTHTYTHLLHISRELRVPEQVVEEVQARLRGGAGSLQLRRLLRQPGPFAWLSVGTEAI